MNERVRRIGKIALTAALVGAVGMGIKEASREAADRERAIDARCGGPTRPDCIPIKTRVPVPHFAGTASSTIIVDFVPKSTPTSTPTELDNGK